MYCERIPAAFEGGRKVRREKGKEGLSNPLLLSGCWTGRDSSNASDPCIQNIIARYIISRSYPFLRKYIFGVHDRHVREVRYPTRELPAISVLIKFKNQKTTQKGKEYSVAEAALDVAVEGRRK